jgi:hypothetical protein
MMGSCMSLVVELIPDEEEGESTARIPAYGEGDTEEAAIADLREAIRGYIEAFGLDDALSRISQPRVRSLDWDLTELARGYVAADHRQGDGLLPRVARGKTLPTPAQPLTAPDASTIVSRRILNGRQNGPQGGRALRMVDEIEPHVVCGASNDGFRQQEFKRLLAAM